MPLIINSIFLLHISDKTGKENKKSEVAKTSSDSDDENNDEDDEKEVEEGDINEDDEKDTEKEVDKQRGQVTMATKIHRIIVASILPKLHKTLTKKVLTVIFFFGGGDLSFVVTRSKTEAIFITLLVFERVINFF